MNGEAKVTSGCGGEVAAIAAVGDLERVFGVIVEGTPRARRIVRRALAEARSGKGSGAESPAAEALRRVVRLTPGARGILADVFGG